MVKNYLVIAWRNLWKHKMFSFINLTGLTISIAVALVVYLIVQYENSFDKHHKNSDKIFRVVSSVSFLGEEFHNPGVPIPLFEVLNNEVAVINETAGFFRLNNYSVTIPGANGSPRKVLKHQDNLVFTDPAYFRILKHQWLRGTPETALNAPFKVVLTESRAKEYFDIGDAADAMGRVIIYSDSIQTMVAGIIKDHERLTDFEFQEFASIGTLTNSGLKDRWYMDRWDNLDSDFQLMLKLADGTAPNIVEAKIQELYGTYDPQPENPIVFFLQPLNDIHFNSIYHAFTRPVANRSTMWGLSILALLLLVLGAINYINLTSSKGNQRAGEVGVRKTLGGTKQQLILQFITETVLLSIIAGLGALLVAPLGMDFFQEFLPSGLVIENIWQPRFILILLAISLVVGILSGIYPGVIMARYKPVSVVSGKKLPKSTRSYMQTGFTVTQFVVASFFIVTTLVVGLQIRYAMDVEMGFDKEGIITFFIPNENQASATFLFNMLTKIPGISGISRGGASPASTGVQSRTLYYIRGKDPVQTHVMLKFGDEHYLDVYGLQLLAGSNISNSDTTKEFIINEVLMRQFGIDNPEDAIGQVVNGEQYGVQIPIVGVVSDFHNQPIHKAIGPVAITNGADGSNFHVKLLTPRESPDTWSEAIDRIEQAWKQVYPDETFDYQFYDQSMASWYQQEMRMAKILKLVTGISILISCLGLLGMVVLETNNRIKEIGVRQVLGASKANLFTLLSKNFFFLILGSVFISFPLAWWFISDWLDNYAYPIAVTWWMFVLPGCLLIVVALITVLAQVLKAALTNPVESLRNE